ncbi:MAG: hypothetical protein ACLGHC_11310, partial [Alphaproteobacteria bacterium]
MDFAARGARLGTITSEATRVRGRYRLSTTKGTLVMVGDYSARNASLAPSITDPLTNALAATKSTPIG